MSSPLSRAIAVTPDNRYIIAGGGGYRDHPGYVKFWNFGTGELVRNDTWKHYVLTNIVTVSDSSSVIVHGRDDHTFLDGTEYVYLGDVERGEYQLIHKWVYHETALTFIHHSKTRIGFDRHIFDLQAKNLSQITPDEEKNIRQLYSKIELTPDYHLSSNDETFVIEDIRTRQVVRKFNPGHENRYHKYFPIKITPDNRYLLAQKGYYGETLNSILSMWEIQTGELVTSFESCCGTIVAIDVTSDNRYAVVYGIDPNYVIRVINLQTGELTLEISPEP